MDRDWEAAGVLGYKIPQGAAPRTRVWHRVHITAVYKSILGIKDASWRTIRYY